MKKTNKKSRTASQEILKTGQGKRLQDFFVSKDFKSRSAFAKAIGVSSSSINEVIWGYKLISMNLLSRIKKRYPQINENWLLNGELPAEFPLIGDSLAEDQEGYMQNEKPNEDMREKIIQQQSALIDQQRETIEQLMKQIKLLKDSKE